MLSKVSAFDRSELCIQSFTFDAGMALASRCSHGGLTVCPGQHDGCLRQVFSQHRCWEPGRKDCLALRFQQQRGCGSCRRRGPAAMALPAIVPSTASQPFGVWAALALAGAAGTLPAQLPDMPLCQQ